MNRYLQQPRPLFIIILILAILLACVIFIFGATATTRGPIEMLAALLLAAIGLLVRTFLLRRS